MTWLTLVKLTLVPGLILVATRIAGRFGPVIGGLVTALPLVAGPITLILAWEQGEGFAVESATGTLRGIPAVAVFCLAYSRLAMAAKPWWLAFCAALTGFSAAAAVLLAWQSTPLTIYLSGVFIVWLVYRLLPKPDGDIILARVDWRQMLVRLLAAVVLVLAVTAGASRSGPMVSGVLVVFPVATTIMAVFTHRSAGAAAAVLLLRGLVAGFVGLLFFYFSLSFLSSKLGFYAAFVLALVAVIIYQYGYSRVLLRKSV
ncbi:hypothetical protein [Teredinibacter turnerae]|uniref:hypothetical protein n=1 Tax=Teredinibacter turnerae TaxID=2426 RepID=UPI000377C7BB|nr:hypothetical protein [Teredinibacter turnerae]